MTCIIKFDQPLTSVGVLGIIILSQLYYPISDSLSADASLQGIKRPSSSQELDSEHSVKKIHLEA